MSTAGDGLEDRITRLEHMLHNAESRIETLVAARQNNDADLETGRHLREALRIELGDLRAQRDHALAEINKLAQFILRDCSGVPNKSAVDTAIQIIQAQRRDVERIRSAHSRLEKAYEALQDRRLEEEFDPAGSQGK